MGNYKKYIFIIIGLLVFILVAPIIIFWLTALLSPFITMFGVVLIIVVISAVIAWKNKIGR